MTQNKQSPVNNRQTRLHGAKTPVHAPIESRRTGPDKKF